MRYRTGPVCSRRGLEAAEKHIPRVGQIYKIRGYRYRNRYGLTEAMMIHGHNGTVQLGGVLWGYGGQGPGTLVQVLMMCGIGRVLAEETAYKSPRLDVVGDDWVIYVTTMAELKRRAA